MTVLHLSQSDVTHPEDLARGLCGCGCQLPLEGLQQGARYATDACRTRAWKERVGYADSRRRKASRNGTVSRRRAGLSIYLPDIATARFVRTVLREKSMDSLGPVVEAFDRAIERAEKRETA